MTFEEYQAQSKKSAHYPKVGQNYVYPALGLAGEAGEIMNKIKKIQIDDGGAVSEDKKYMIMDELGDMVWYVAQLSTELDIDLGEVVELNMQKIASRM